MFSILKSDLVNPFQPMDEQLNRELDKTITQALAELKPDNIFADIDQSIVLRIIAEEDCVLCGAPWVDGLLEKIHFTGNIQWHAIEGATVLGGDKICTIYGKAKEIIGKEKIILDFLSLFSSLTTQARNYAELVSGTKSLLYYDYLNIPGCTLSQQYAVHIGGAQGYSVLDDGTCLIKRGHIHLLNGISAALKQALCHYSIDFIKVEVSSYQELSEVVKLGIKNIKLCFFTLEQLAQAQELVKEKITLEAYGNVHLSNIKQIAQIGIERIIMDDFGKKISIISYALSYLDD
ncbi:MULTISPECIES: nicotinate-nucleotide diphosphorylase [Commensalibacter]|uniref:Nicotinate-nucleotide pyrophosphorylase n=2 Tax=Commensalibacter TaxID=1079922 RepID=W7DU17_9PROT|nr:MULTISPECIES: hypothetical protein [Commensalibacter]EUK18525.1 nicotinate-nucleotide pyrophosphorylase [Commensalibacter papalotli (ex Servin-Garciduenas et al. 2014)]CAI3932293.1 Nicotinate-nucleotide pyrophosphorylase (NadC) (PDB:1O4U) [Commensalibacter papalotli (ex Botero et al. 2024)]CAI3943388.1 Nicotinate-nucleotide pyrophosphorylase (NadC) (PDB:1O4U) [Commensalibacter papalotli (ex Botero et al. 2024)]